MPYSLRELLDLDGQTFADAERYLVTRFIGEGARGKVLLATDRKLSREVAIKLMVHDGERDTAARFYREAKALAALNHPSIMKVLDYSGPTCPRPYLVIEKLSGADFDTLASHEMFTEVETLAVLHELAGALDCAHEAGILHRDVKPQNAMLEPNGRVVLLDFGLAKGMRAAGERETFVASETKLVGTPTFASPEQCTGESPASPASDLFSLGSTVYYMASQVLPFRGETMLELVTAVVACQPMPLNQLVDGQAAFFAIVDKLLQRSPGDRFARGQEVQEACVEALAQLRVFSPGKVLAEAARRRQVVPSEHRPIEMLGRTLNDIRVRLQQFDEALPKPRAPESTQIANLRDAKERTRLALMAGTQALGSNATQTQIASKPVAQTFKTTTKLGQGSSQSVRRERVPMVAMGAALVLAGIGGGALLKTWLRHPAPVPVPAATAVPAHTPVPAPMPSRVPPDLPAPAPELATLRVIVLPWGDVEVDGVKRGTTPRLRTLQVPAGKHVVVISHPELGKRTHEVSLDDPEHETVLEVDLSHP